MVFLVTVVKQMVVSTLKITWLLHFYYKTMVHFYNGWTISTMVNGYGIYFVLRFIKLLVFRVKYDFWDHI